jgi:uncharacterized iron-regulated membrane protein
MRKAVLSLHRYLALLVGLLIMTQATTGSIVAFEGDLDRMANPALFKVAPTAQPKRITALIGALLSAYPDDKFTYINTPSRANQAYSAETGKTEVFLNQYTGHVIGSRSHPTRLDLIHQVHVRLLSGATGETITAVSAFLLVWLVSSGAYLWWPVKRAHIRFGASSRRVLFDIHNTVGIYIASFLLATAVTGILIHFDRLAGKIDSSVHASPLNFDPRSDDRTAAPPISPDEAVQIAKATLPGASLNGIGLPGGTTGAYVIALRFPEDHTNSGRSRVGIDQYTGKVLLLISSRNPPLGTRIFNNNRALHTGDLLGYPTRILMACSSLLLILQTLIGYVMWWKGIRLRIR